MPWADNSSLDESYVRWTWYPPPDEVGQAIDFAYSLPIHGVEYDDGVPAEPPFTDIPLKPGRPYVCVYLPVSVEPETAAAIAAFCQEHGWALEHEQVQSEDWANAWKAYYQPQFFHGGFVVVPSWITPSPADDAHTIWLDPGMAFGTGTHATTRLCANALVERLGVGQSVLDLGAGSGILGIMAAKQGAGQVVMVEPDPVAVDAMCHNVRLNGVEAGVSVVAGTLVDVAPHPFDVLCLNLIWDIIAAEWDRLQDYVAPGATLLLSGILPERASALREMVARTGQTLERLVEEEGWLMAVVTHDSPRD